MKKGMFIIALIVLFSASVVFADNAEFRLQVTRNDGHAGGEFHVTLQMRISAGSTSPRTLNSMTVDVYYTSQLNPWGDDWPGTGWAFDGGDGYNPQADKISIPTNHYRVTVTGNGVGQSGPGSPAGWNVTTTWQDVVTLRWTIAEASSVNITIGETAAAAYFENIANNPKSDAMDWVVSNEDLGDVSLPVVLVSYAARCTEGGVLLEWVTESELENAGFILDRRGDKEAEWTTIASYKTHDALQGQGNTSSRTEYEFVDENVQPGETYSYRLSDVDLNGKASIDDVISITLDALPEMTDLLPAFPNPFNPQTKIQYTLSEDTNVSLSVVDMMGRTVQTIIRGQNQVAGSYSLHWNGKDDSGRMASSGTYLLVLKAGDILKTEKVMLVR